MSDVKETNYEHYKDEIIKHCIAKKQCEFIRGTMFKTNDCSKYNTCSECREEAFKWLDELYEEPVIEIDWDRVPVDTPVMVCDFEHGDYERSHFCQYKPENSRSFICFANGRSSHTNDGVTSWFYCELAREEDVEKYKK